MRCRPVFHVAGPSGGGKTLFIERLLEAQLGLTTCVRATFDPEANRPVASTPALHPEIHRYRAAGASTSATYRFAEANADSFYCADPMEEYSQAIVIEGADPMRGADLGIFVAAPLSADQPLLRKVAQNRSRSRRATLALLEGTIDDASVRSILGDPRGTAAERQPDLARELREIMLGGAAGSRARPRSKKQWAVAPEYVGIERAGLVILNVRSEGERSAAEPLLEQISRLRKDKQVYDDVIGYGDKRPITAVVADLSDPKDPGLKKALAKIKRLLARLAM